MEIYPNTNDTCNAATLAPISPSTNQTCISHGGLTRCWYTYVPEKVKNSTSAVPLVIDLHGYQSCAMINPFYTKWKELSDKNGDFIVMYPQGNMDLKLTRNTCWNAGSCCCFGDNAFTPNFNASDVIASIDDVGFLRQAISNVVADVDNIDIKRIYFAGHSNGCMMAQKMAAETSDLVASVCCHSGFLVTDVPESYDPTPINVIFGNEDPLVPFDSDSVVLPFLTNSAMENFQDWGSFNGCNNLSIMNDTSGMYATHQYSNCTNDAIVELIEIYGVGHIPFEGIETTLDTTKMAWDFCRQYESIDPPTLLNTVSYVEPYIFKEIIEPIPGSGSDTNGVLEKSLFLSLASTIFALLCLIK